MDVAALIAREQLRDSLARIARGEDRREAALIRSGYWPDATVDLGIFIGGFEEYLAWVVPGAPSIPVTLHTLGQSLIELAGDEARVETHVTAYHRIDMGEEHRDVVLGGRYLDRFERRGQEWRITRRVMMSDWLQDFGRAVDWSQGLMGVPFLRDGATGQAHGDWSEIFFRGD